MGLAQELLEQAEHLATYQGLKPNQAALRRSVSTAYYALFHPLGKEVGQQRRGVDSASATGLERALNHGQVKDIGSGVLALTRARA